MSPDGPLMRLLAARQGKQKAVSSGVPADAVVVADVAKGRTPELDAALKGADSLIIATSAVPQVHDERAVRLSVRKTLYSPTNGCMLHVDMYIRYRHISCLCLNQY